MSDVYGITGSLRFSSAAALKHWRGAAPASIAPWVKAHGEWLTSRFAGTTVDDAACGLSMAKTDLPIVVRPAFRERQKMT